MDEGVNGERLAEGVAMLNSAQRSTLSKHKSPGKKIKTRMATSSRRLGSFSLSHTARRDSEGD